jgi:hypothetical protein
VTAIVAHGSRSREPPWSEALAVGRRTFVEEIHRQLGMRARYREIVDGEGVSVLRDGEALYRPVSRSKRVA